MEDQQAIAEINFSGLKFKWICITMCVGFAALGWGIGPVSSCAATSCAETNKQSHAERLALIEATGSPAGISGCNPTQDQYLKMKYGSQETESKTESKTESPKVGDTK